MSKLGPYVDWLCEVRKGALAHAFEQYSHDEWSHVSLCGKQTDDDFLPAASTDKRCKNCMTRLARLERVRAEKKS